MDIHSRISLLTQDEAVSDIHLREGEPLWVRRAGNMQAQTGDAPRIVRNDLLELLKRNESHSGLKVAKMAEALTATGDKDLTLKIGAKRYRANLYWCNGQRLALALRRQSESLPELEDLGLPGAYTPLLSQKGLVLVTGATGSGKTTTLAASVEHLNETTSSHIITLEDPVEYLLNSKSSRVDQRQVGRDVVSFGAGLRAALRQDPDVLLVGELRDFETVKTALDAANTGHLVLATLHTNSAQQTIERVTSFFEDDGKEWANAVLSQVLLGVLSQVLVPTVNGKKRVLAAELLVNTNDVKTLIRDGKTHQILNAIETGLQKGQVSLNKTLVSLVKKNVVNPRSALLATYDVANLKKDFARDGIRF